MKLLFTSLLSISLSVLQLKAQTNSNTLLDYISTTPSANQFDKSIQTGSGSSIDIVSNKLNLLRTGNTGGSSITRFTSIGLPTIAVPLQLSFDFDCSKPVGVPSGVGANFTIGAITSSDGGNSSRPLDEICTFRVRFNTDSVVSGKFRIENFKSGNIISGFTPYHTGSVHVVAIFNPTTSNFDYDGPNSTTGTLAAGKVDIFMDGIKEITGGTIINSVVAKGFKINLGGVNSNVNFDNIIIQDALPASFFLPVNLTSFTGKSFDNGVTLNWSTVSEQNSDYFALSKFDAIINSDIPIGKVKAAGNSISLINYQYRDARPQSGVNYYQLKQVDKDGTFKTYPVTAVNYELNSFKFDVFKSEENTYKFGVFSNEQKIVEMSLISLDGRVLSQKTVQLSSGYNSGTLATTFLNSGLYLVRLKDAKGQVFVKKLMISAN